MQTEFELSGQKLIWVLDRRTRMAVEIAFKMPWNELVKIASYSNSFMEQILYSGVRDLNGQNISEAQFEKWIAADVEGFKSFAEKVTNVMKESAPTPPLEEAPSEMNSKGGAASDSIQKTTGQRKIGKSKL